MDYNYIKDLLDKYLEGNSTLKEEEILYKYFTQNTNLPSEFDYAKGIFSFVKEEKKWEYTEKKTFRKSRFIIRLSAVAACFAIFLGIAYILHKPASAIKEITQINKSSKAKKIVLDDGNIVWLNKNSSVTYFNIANPYNNILDVHGEVYLEILNPQSCNYQVLAKSTIVQVDTPTSFNLQIKHESTEITVESGLVKVLGGGNENGMALLITEGNYCSVNEIYNLAFTANNKNNNYLAWKTGKLVFNNMPMATVSDILSEYYNVTIELQDKKIAYCEFSGQFERKSIDFILKKIRTELKVDIKTQDNVIVLSGKNCF